jgi:4-amino-4-deoxy-L-arabinose transferase-like glycosyltransferase
MPRLKEHELKLRSIRGPLIAGTSAVLLYILMVLPKFSPFGMVIGVALLVALVSGILDIYGSLHIIKRPSHDELPERALTEDLPLLLKWLTYFNIRLLYAGLALYTAGACRLSVMGTMGAAAPWSGPVLFGIGTVLIVAARFVKKPFDGNFHEGFLVFWMSFATIMATLGSQGLWDCWETHYGEVARRQLEQDDWISLFWEDAWFFSKPILIFWMMNLGMSLFHVDVRPDHISGHVEWGVRFAVGLLAICIVWGIYKLLAERVSKRAGLFTAAILITMPLYGFMARQAITDLPFAGFMILAVVMFLLGITADKDALCRPVFIPIGRKMGLNLGAFHALIAGYIAVGIPQFLYIASRSASFQFGTFGHDDIRNEFSKNQFTKVHFDLQGILRTLYGRVPSIHDISLDWILLGLAFLLPFVLILFSIRKERRISKLCFHGMYIFLALSVMAKGLPGLALPILALFGFLAVIAPWKLLASPKQFIAWFWGNVKRIEMPRGIAMFLLLSLPWYIAMTVRHGMAFINRFIIHDHFKRLAEGVHGESGTFQYFMEQFGYAAFPFSALLPFAILAWPALYTKPHAELCDSDRAARTIRLFMTSLAIVSYALFSMMVTKFHHYVFPLLFPSAVLIGMMVDDIWQNRLPKIGLVVVTALVILTAIAQDLIVDPHTKAQGVIDGHTQLVGLFIYKYSRPYPDGDAYNFFLPLLVFSILFGALFLGWLYAARRRVAIVLTFLAALAFSHFLNQHYLVKLAPHWTQKHLIEEYYQLRDSDDERLVAFQMNWKGENFYTGNRMIPFDSTKSNDFDKWVDKHRGERHFFITEQSRFNRMSTRVKAASGKVEPLHDTCNKYKIGVADKL